MATMVVGHYPIIGNTSEHAFAKMKIGETEYRFQCYGGTNDKGTECPAHYFLRRSSFYFRIACETAERELTCHARIALCLAQWTRPIYFDKYDYNSKKGGYGNRGDSAGIIYALTGLCHQMCNTITCATNVNDPLHALINWPPSLSASKIIYGNRGIWGHERAISKYVKTLVACYGENMSDDHILDENFDSAALDAELAAINDEQDAAIRWGLTNGPNADERREFLSELVPNLNESQPILDADFETMSLKHELDNLLIRGQLSNEEYAAQMNEATRTLLVRYAEVMGENVFTDAFETGPDTIQYNIINPEYMLDDYEIVKEELGL